MHRRYSVCHGKPTRAHQRQACDHFAIDVVEETITGHVMEELEKTQDKVINFRDSLASLSSTIDDHVFVGGYYGQLFEAAGFHPKMGSVFTAVEGLRRALSETILSVENIAKAQLKDVQRGMLDGEYKTDMIFTQIDLELGIKFNHIS